MNQFRRTTHPRFAISASRIDKFPSFINLVHAIFNRFTAIPYHSCPKMIRDKKAFRRRIVEITKMPRIRITFFAQLMNNFVRDVRSCISPCKSRFLQTSSCSQKRVIRKLITFCKNFAFKMFSLIRNIYSGLGKIRSLFFVISRRFTL